MAEFRSIAQAAFAAAHELRPSRRAALARRHQEIEAENRWYEAWNREHPDEHAALFPHLAARGERVGGPSA